MFTRATRFVVTAATWVAAFGLSAVPVFAGGATTTTARPAKQPPFYHGKLPTSGAKVGHLPILIDDPNSSLPPGWAPAAALERLASDVDAALERLGTSGRVPTSFRAVAPWIYLGCEEDSMVPGECAAKEEARQNVLVTNSGTQEWRAWVAEAAREAGVERVLVLRLDLAPHWIHQRGLKGAKEVRLGTDNVQSLRWLTSLETPVYVLQITGALVDAEGRVLRSGAEGVWAKRTPFKVSVLRAQSLLTDEDVEFVRTSLRRDDLPDQPLAWEAALGNLVRQLTVTKAPEKSAS